MQKYSKIIGVIGGAGPDAAVDFQRQLFKQMKLQLNAALDQEHYRVIVDNYTDMPDRAIGYLGKGMSPLPHMIATAKNLENLGCSVIAYPCNTAHVYLADISDAVNIPMLDMTKITVDSISEKYNDGAKVGLLCTDLTKNTKLYDNSGFATIYPDAEHQALVMQAIFAAKAGYTDTGISSALVRGKVKQYLLKSKNYDEHSFDFSLSSSEILINASKNLITKGANIIIMGCTEIPLCISENDLMNSLKVDVVNPTVELAKATLNKVITNEMKLAISS